MARLIVRTRCSRCEREFDGWLGAYGDSFEEPHLRELACTHCGTKTLYRYASPTDYAKISDHLD